jgi:hypothetical protein
MPNRSKPSLVTMCPFGLGKLIANRIKFSECTATPIYSACCPRAALMIVSNQMIYRFIRRLDGTRPNANINVYSSSIRRLVSITSHVARIMLAHLGENLIGQVELR